MRIFLLPILFFYFTVNKANAQAIKDDFEGNGNISTWFGDACLVNTNLANPFKQSINTSNTVLEYKDNGGLYANIRFDLTKNLDLSKSNIFSIKIYVASNTLTGNQPNKVSLKLQDGKLSQPWSTQTEIIKSIVLNQWQTISFDFEKDNFINLNSGSVHPKLRTDFSRILIQVNGENNTDKVIAYIDDFNFERTDSFTTIFKKLVWSDEFDSSGTVNDKKWFHQTKLPEGGSWYNGEIQHYTNRIENSKVENGILKVIAKKESFADQGFTKQYTSARLNSKFAFKYGRVEFRAKLPTGNGTWPAVWLLGKNINEDGAYWDNLGYGKTNWPACGEIDILEHWGANQNYVQSAIHSPSSFGGTVNLGGQTINTASTAFHVYSMEWTAEKMVFSVDSNIHYTYNPTEKNASTWPFDAEQYFILNFAIQPSIAANFTQGALEIDYIRVYQENTSTNLKVEHKNQPFFYPNPVNNELNIVLDYDYEKSIQVLIHSIDGKLLINDEYLVKNGAIHLNNLNKLAKGVYLVSFEINQQLKRFKIIKN
jgi:beta-glucanase (GH16 family)